jgi:hypothetical protein
MNLSPQRTSARPANSRSKLMLSAIAAAASVTVLVGGGSAAADEMDAAPAAVIEFPPGLTMRSFETPGSSAILVSGCPAGGTVTVENHVEIPLGNGETSSVPVSVLPALNVPDDGVVALPLQLFSEFFDATQPSPEAQLVVAARCDPDGPWESRKVPLDDGDLGTTPPTLVPSPAAPPAPAPAPTDDTPVEQPADGDRSRLPETGLPTGLTGPVGLGVLLTLIGGGIIAVRSRLNPRHRAAGD